MDEYRLNNIFDANAIQDGPIRWYPLQRFLDSYNQKVQNLPLRGGFVRDRFKLIKSASIRDLENGLHPFSLGHQWEAHINCRFEDTHRWCDVQVNYQMSLRTLETNLDGWIAIWDSMWAAPVTNSPLDDRLPDPKIGDNKRIPVAELYKVQAMLRCGAWRKLMRINTLLLPPT
jgi:hypothetical protein